MEVNAQIVEDYLEQSNTIHKRNIPDILLVDGINT